MSATSSVTYSTLKSQSPVSTYKRNNRTVAEFYDPGTATYGYRIDLGQVREFKTRRAMEAALDAEFKAGVGRGQYWEKADYQRRQRDALAWIDALRPTPKPAPRPTVKAPAVRLPDLPQLPANVPVRQTRRQALAQLRSTGNTLPTRGIIPLDAPKPPQNTPAIAVLPRPQIAGLLPAMAGLKPGECQGWLNAHWSPLATDGWVFETRGKRLCPHCLSAFEIAMDSLPKAA